MPINYHPKYDDGKGAFNQNLLLEMMTAENDRLEEQQREIDELHKTEGQPERQEEKIGDITNLPRHIQQNILIYMLEGQQNELRNDMNTVNGQIAVAKRNLQKLNDKRNIKFSEEVSHNTKIFNVQEDLYNSEKRKNNITKRYNKFEEIITGRLQKLAILDQLSKRRMAEFSRE
tara:strand:- start:39 stop:560 length:522 start_codon:yes stop_codon:yes gene_type:complete